MWAYRRKHVHHNHQLACNLQVRSLGGGGAECRKLPPTKSSAYLPPDIVHLLPGRGSEVSPGTQEENKTSPLRMWCAPSGGTNHGVKTNSPCGHQTGRAFICPEEVFPAKAHVLSICCSWRWRPKPFDKVSGARPCHGTADILSCGFFPVSLEKTHQICSTFGNSTFGQPAQFDHEVLAQNCRRSSVLPPIFPAVVYSWMNLRLYRERKRCIWSLCTAVCGSSDKKCVW